MEYDIDSIKKSHELLPLFRFYFDSQYRFLKAIEEDGPIPETISELKDEAERLLRERLWHLGVNDRSFADVVEAVRIYQREYFEYYRATREAPSELLVLRTVQQN